MDTQQECHHYQPNPCVSPDTGQGGVPKGAKTSEYYRVDNIPTRFNNPGKCYAPGNPVFSCQLDVPTKTEYTPSDQDWFQGYNTKPVNAIYRTSNSEYGARPPSVHTMPTKFMAKSQQFSKELGKFGMPRDHSLNCGTDKKLVPDH